MNWYNRQLKMAMPQGIKKEWTNDELEKIKELIAGGDSLRQIAKLFGVAPSLISKLNKDHVMADIEDIKNKKYKWIASLYLLPPDGKGLPAKQIYKKYGVSPSTVRFALESLGLIDHWRGQSEAQIKMLQDNPDILKERSERTKQFAKNNPEVIKERAEKMRQLYIDEPERRKEVSDRMKQEWKDIGYLEGLLKSYRSRNEAINYLNQFISAKIHQSGKGPFTYNTYNKYMKIINEHTYSDEVQQGAIV